MNSKEHATRGLVMLVVIAGVSVALGLSPKVDKLSGQLREDDSEGLATTTSVASLSAGLAVVSGQTVNAQSTADAGNVTGATALAQAAAANVTGAVALAQSTFASNGVGTVSGLVGIAQAAGDWASNSSTVVSQLLVAARFNYVDYTFVGTQQLGYALAGGFPRDEAQTISKIYFRSTLGTGTVVMGYIVTNGTIASWVTNGSVDFNANGVYGTITDPAVPAAAQQWFYMTAYDPDYFPTQNVRGGAKMTW